MKVFSGIQPTSDIHIGNYLGAIKQWVALQNTAECVFCIVDWHAITVNYDPKEFQQQINRLLAVYLGAGLNPEKSIIFKQSDVKEHAELAWLLNTITPLGELERMTQFKDKSQKNKANINAGLLNYPVLMAADILLYQTDLVPVGQDQKQHAELTRMIANRFNKKFGEVFTIPKAFIPKQGAKIMSLTEPEKKMSKSDSENSRISLFDSPETISKKIASATTDSDKEVKYDIVKKPGISNLLTIYSLFSDKTIKEIEKDFAGKGYVDFKKSLSCLLINKLSVFRDKQKELEKNPQTLQQIIDNGSKRATIKAQATMDKVRVAMGL